MPINLFDILIPFAKSFISVALPLIIIEYKCLIASDFGAAFEYGLSSGCVGKEFPLAACIAISFPQCGQSVAMQL